jgi:hypothetical protein
VSIEATLHPRGASRKQLKDFLLCLGYRPCGSLWSWPKGSLTFHWFESRDFQSFDGVEATIYPPSEDPHRLGPCQWALHTRTRSSGSPADKVFQNQTIRQARGLFGGSFYNDWAGKNRYSTPPREVRTPASRGLYLAYETVQDHLKAVRYALPGETEGLSRLEGTELADLAQVDPARVLYNALVPFALASLEGFFSRAFVILVTYDASAQAYLAKQSRKIDFEDAAAIARRETSLEAIVAGWYSFQNLPSLQKAYSEWLGLDVRGVLATAKLRRKEVRNLDEAFAALIAFRHRVIHSFELDFRLRREPVLKILEDAQSIIDAFVEHLEQAHGYVIRDSLAWARQ